MTDTVYVRFPDETKDDASKPGKPNPVKQISAKALDTYRGNGFVQCAADGSALPAAEVVPVGGPAKSSDGPKLATADDDPEAKKLGEDVDPEAVADSAAASAKNATATAGKDSK